MNEESMNTTPMPARFCSILCSFLALSLSAQSIDRIEPPNWWVGMKNPAVQLMIHGERIRDLNPVIKYSGVKITGTHTTENPNYLFVDLTVSNKSKPGTVTIDFYAGRTKLLTEPWKLEAREPGSAERPGVDQSDVIYLITPDRFANGDPSNDTVEGLKEAADRAQKGGRHGGDIEGVRTHLDYIHDMGFTAIWLNPVLENDMYRSSYHGYATTDYYKVDPRFGSNEAYQKLVQESRAMGIKQIMDMIPNHCGSEHWWIHDMPSQDWIHHWDNYTQTNHRKTTPLDLHASAYDLQVFTDGWFVRSMPDLNQRNPLLATYLTQNAIWWVEYLGLSGIRIDTYPYSDPEFSSKYCKAILAEYPHLFIVGECWHMSPAVIAPWQKGFVNKNGYVSNLPFLMDFPLQSTLVHALNTISAGEDPWVPVYETLAQDDVYASPMDMMIFADNHDMSRIYTQVNEDYDLYRLAMACILTMRGVPQIFYGTEILMDNAGTDEHTIIRSDFPGGWAGDPVNGFSGDGLSDQQQDAQHFMRTLLHWRQTASVIHTGKLMHFAPMDNVYVYFRYDDAKRVMVILNKNKTPYSLDLSPFHEMLTGVSKGRDVLTGKEYEMTEALQLEGEGPLILELY